VSLVATAGRNPSAPIPWGRTRDPIRHAVDVAEGRLLSSGDTVVTVCGTTLVAFDVGPRWEDCTGRRCKRCLAAKTTDVAIHMTETRLDLRWDEWIAYCRCGWAGSYLKTQAAARADGDRHLTETNGASR
jgi:hypothetical protein